MDQEYLLSKGFQNVLEIMWEAIFIILCLARSVNCGIGGYLTVKSTHRICYSQANPLGIELAYTVNLDIFAQLNFRASSPW